MHKKSLFKAWSTETLDDMWWWLREDPASWLLKEKALLMRTLPGTLWGTNNSATNILLRPEIGIESGLTSQVTVTNQPQIQGEQAGLIWYNDEDNYIKLVKELLNGTVWIVLAREQAEKATLVAKIPMLTESARLRLTLTGQIVNGWARSSDSDSWEKVGECALVNNDRVHLGVFTHGGPAEEERWVSLRQFHIFISS